MMVRVAVDAAGGYDPLSTTTKHHFDSGTEADATLFLIDRADDIEEDAFGDGIETIALLGCKIDSVDGMDAVCKWGYGNKIFMIARIERVCYRSGLKPPRGCRRPTSCLHHHEDQELHHITVHRDGNDIEVAPTLLVSVLQQDGHLPALGSVTLARCCAASSPQPTRPRLSANWRGMRVAGRRVAPSAHSKRD